MSVMTYNAFVPANPVAESLQRAGLVFGNAILFVANGIAQAYLKARTRAQLEALDADQLADIGLERADISKTVAAL